MSWTKTVIYLNLNTMKQHIKKAAFVFAASLALIACEKDQAEPTNRMNGGDAVKSKNVQSINKNPVDSATYFTLLNYVYDLDGGSTPPTVDWHSGMLNVETALNYSKANLGKTSTHSELIDISASATVSGSAGGYELSGSHSLSLFDDLITEIDDAYYESDLYATYGSDAFISLVDVTFDESPSSAGSITVYATVWVKYYLEPDFPFCDFENDWKALDRLGLCSGGSTGVDAARRLEGMVTNDNCNEYFAPYNCSPLLYSIVRVTNDGFNSSNIWDGTAASNCISSTALNYTWRPGIDTETSNMNPSPILLPQSTFYVYPIDYSVGKASIGSNVAHDLSISYAAFLCHPMGNPI